MFPAILAPDDTVCLAYAMFLHRVLEIHGHGLANLELRNIEIDYCIHLYHLANLLFAFKLLARIASVRQARLVETALSVFFVVVSVIRCPVLTVFAVLV